MYFNPDGKQLEVFLGSLEAQLMEIAWEQGEISVKRAMHFLPPDDPKAYTTVMTVLKRLYEKNLLKREKAGRNFIYQPNISKSEFIKQKVHSVKAALKQFQ